ncbi:MAG TPA: glutathione binding-like protein [Polyangiaceae bacterium]|nr:glutathione binding-like protein [Polyangiaceae bacterium]
MIHVYGHPLSTCTRKVLTSLVETNTPYELHVVDFAKNEHKQEPHILRQPFGQVPAINDEGFELFESRAICRYISRKADNRLTPADPKACALMDQWLSIEQSNFSPAAMKFVYHYVFQRPQEDSVLEGATKMLETCYGVMSSALEKSSFLVGEQFTIADIGYMPYIEYMLGSPAKATLDKFPRVSAWWQRVSERPSWRKVTGKG